MKTKLVSCILFLFITICSNAQSSKSDKISKKENQKYIDFDEISLDIPYDKIYYYNTSQKKYDKNGGEDDGKKSIWSATSWENISYLEKYKMVKNNLDYELAKLLKRTGYIDTVNRIFKDEANSLMLKFTVKDLNFYHVGSSDFFAKKMEGFAFCKATIMWKIANTYGEIFDSVSITAQSINFDSTEKFGDMTYKMFDNSVSQLIANSKVSKYFAVNEKAETKLALTTLAKPTAFIANATEAQPSTVIVKTKDGHGSGFAITNDGYIITNYHVIASEDPAKPKELTIILDEGTKLKATVVTVNKDRDIALLKVDNKFTKCFQLPTAKNFAPFEEVFAMGAPKSVELGQSASKGIISSERNINNVSLIQTNININGGNSGGPMFNKDGKLYGVVTSKLFGIGVEGVAFCLPAYKIKDYLNIEFK